MVKDKEYWKEYNSKRKAYIQQKNKERYLNDSQRSKGCINTTDKDTTKNNTNTDTTFNTTELKKDTTIEQIQPINTTREELIQPIQPTQELIQLSETVKPCSRCPEIENSISNFANLYREEQEKVKQLEKEKKQSEKQAKELELKIISLQETNQILRKDLDIWQKPINPTIERWKADYFKLEKETNQQLSEQSETISSLKEKLRILTNEKQTWEQKYRSLENTSKNISQNQIKVYIYQLATKYERLKNIQHRYSSEEVQELRFLKDLYDKIWSLAGLVS